MGAIPGWLRRKLREQIVEFVEAPKRALGSSFVLASLLAFILPTDFYKNSLAAVFGAGFTMLGFGLTAASVLTSLMSSEYVMRLKATDNWKHLTFAFSRANAIFWVLTLFTLMMFSGILELGSPLSVISRILYMGLLGCSFAAAGTIVFLLHKVLNFPLTDAERQKIERRTNPVFPPPTGGRARANTEEILEVDIVEG